MCDAVRDRGRGGDVLAVISGAKHSRMAPTTCVLAEGDRRDSSGGAGRRRRRFGHRRFLTRGPGHGGGGVGDGGWVFVWGRGGWGGGLGVHSSDQVQEARYPCCPSVLHLRAPALPRAFARASACLGRQLRRAEPRALSTDMMCAFGKCARSLTRGCAHVETKSPRVSSRRTRLLRRA